MSGGLDPNFGEVGVFHFRSTVGGVWGQTLSVLSVAEIGGTAQAGHLQRCRSGEVSWQDVTFRLRSAIGARRIVPRSAQKSEHR